MNFIICSKGHQAPLGSRFCQHCGDQLSTLEPGTAEAILSEKEIGELPHGTRLRDRYVIIEKLGQGGFGKTYLAEDTGRFNEKVAIKEFVPTLQGTNALEKAEELFQREAVTLHQLQHVQIPRFWEMFREGKRLFLVEDFIEGQTYQSLLEQRLQQGQCFKEAEILKLFRELLPVLSYLHRQGVIHRDISPDNIMLRAKDQQAVLIDLGGVKQVAIDIATQFAGGGNSASSRATCLGKVGYAPDEQLRLGIVAPHSDLYGLAVTALVLMTGKQPQDLLDQHTLHWTWHRELSLSPSLTKILNQMLHRQPSGRFKSADEILQLLQSSSSSRTYAATKSTELLQSNSSSKQIYAANQTTKFKVTTPVNNSGQGGIFDSSVGVPDEIKGWNWGASLLPLFWCFPNRFWIGLLFYAPVFFLPGYVSLGIAAIFGMNGNKWAWKSRKWSSIAVFKAHQRAWTKWGLIINGSLLTLALIIISLAGIASKLKSSRVSSVTPLSTPNQEVESSKSSSSPTYPSSTQQSTEPQPANENIEVPTEYDWMAVVRSVKGDIIYLDRNPLLSNGVSIRFWSQHVPKGDNRTFDQTYIQADCFSRAYEIKKILVYKNGYLVFKDEPRNAPASRAEPETVMEAMIKKVCSLH